MGKSITVGIYLSLWWLLLAVGCTENNSNSENNTDDTAEDTGTDGDADTDADTTPEVDPFDVCESDQDNVGNGYHYEMWIQDGTMGNACMTVKGKDAQFKVDWDLAGYGFVARVGLKFNETKTAEQIGRFSSEFAFTKSGNGPAYMGIYGWMVNPLKEYYIVEDWNLWRPEYEYKGTITVDGGDYDVYTNQRVQQPSIKGTQTFEQWFSVRKTPRRSGHISISEHFDKWAELGMDQGRMYEAKLKVEGLGGSGTVDFTTAQVTVEPAE